MYTTDAVKSPEMTYSFAAEVMDGLKDQLVELEDCVGHKWLVRIKVQQVPHPQQQRSSILRATLRLETSLDKGSLIKAGVFDTDNDKRLLAFIGSKRISLHSKAQQAEAESLTQLRVSIVNLLKAFDDQLQSGKMEQVKKQVVVRWVDQSQMFGASESY
jgi:hypothetical protein